MSAVLSSQWPIRVMERHTRKVLSVHMTRRLETVLLFSMLVGLACCLALTSITAGTTSFLR